MNQLLSDNRNTESAALLDVTADVAGLRTLIANLYFIDAPGKSSEWILVDAGVGRCAAEIIAAAESRYGAEARPAAIILTHGHFDHVGGLPELLEKWNVPVFAHRLELPFLDGRSSYPPGDPGVGGGAMAWLSFVYPREPLNLKNLHELPKDGSVPFLPDWCWIHTPGHTPGHISLFRAVDGLLIAGDAIVTTRQESAISAITQKPQEIHRPPAYFTIDWQLAADSVRYLADLRPEIVAAGHGLPMRGEQMRSQLRILAEHFEEIAVPNTGRYVKNPAVADETGIKNIPPPTLEGQFPKLVAGMIAVGAFYGIWSLLRRRG